MRVENYRTSAHARFDIKYHFVSTTKCRKAALTGPVGLHILGIGSGYRADPPVVMPCNTSFRLLHPPFSAYVFRRTFTLFAIPTLVDMMAEAWHHS